jgi:hypothetical protein
VKEMALATAYIAPEVAPKATTRAEAADRDFVNSDTSPVILPRGWLKDVALSVIVIGVSTFLRRSATFFSGWTVSSRALMWISLAIYLSYITLKNFAVAVFKTY